MCYGGILDLAGRQVKRGAQVLGGEWCRRFSGGLTTDPGQVIVLQGMQRESDSLESIRLLFSHD